MNLSKWFKKKVKKQFTVKLQPYDGQYHNFFAYGAFETMLKTNRLLYKIDFGPEKCHLVFEPL